MVNTKKHLRNCNFCGREYRYCGNCSEFNHLPAYMLAFCSENCKDIDSIISNWGAKVIDSATAAELLKSKDLSRMEYWSDNYKACYAKIMEDVGTPIIEKEEVVEEKQEVKSEDKPEDKPEEKHVSKLITHDIKKETPKTYSRTRQVKQNKEEK